MNSSRQDQTRLTCLSWTHWNDIQQSHLGLKLTLANIMKLSVVRWPLTFWWILTKQCCENMNVIDALYIDGHRESLSAVNIQNTWKGNSLLSALWEVQHLKHLKRAPWKPRLRQRADTKLSSLRLKRPAWKALFVSFVSLLYCIYLCYWLYFDHFQG